MPVRLSGEPPGGTLEVAILADAPAGWLAAGSGGIPGRSRLAAQGNSRLRSQSPSWQAESLIYTGRADRVREPSGTRTRRSCWVSPWSGGRYPPGSSCRLKLPARRPGASRTSSRRPSARSSHDQQRPDRAAPGRDRRWIRATGADGRSISGAAHWRSLRGDAAGRMRSRHPALQDRRAESEPTRSAPYLWPCPDSRNAKQRIVSRGGRL
jgi:hypothetical protein